jgi:hypothetical protein
LKILVQHYTRRRHQRQRAATSSDNRQIQLLRPRRLIRRAPNDRAARFIDDRSDSVSGRFSISTTRGQHHLPSSMLEASCVTRKHRAATLEPTGPSFASDQTNSPFQPIVRDDATFNIDPPASSYAIMRRARPCFFIA